MKKILVLVCALMLFSCTKEDGSIFGVASADGGNVLSGITVKLYAENTELLRETQTDGEGNFLFTGLEAANYFVGATITVDGVVWDTGNRPQIFYVGEESAREVTLTLNEKN